MSFIAPPREGAEIVRQLLKYNGLIVQRSEFGRLMFTVDVNACALVDAAALIDDLAEIDSTLDTLYIDTAGVICFDYYVTVDLVAPIYSTVRRYCKDCRAELLSWSYIGR